MEDVGREVKSVGSAIPYMNINSFGSCDLIVLHL